MYMKVDDPNVNPLPKSGIHGLRYLRVSLNSKILMSWFHMKQHKTEKIFYGQPKRGGKWKNVMHQNQQTYIYDRLYNERIHLKFCTPVV